VDVADPVGRLTFPYFVPFFYAPPLFIKFYPEDKTKLGPYYNVGWILGLTDIYDQRQ
jgi:hypothetical protein